MADPQRPLLLYKDGVVFIVSKYDIREDGMIMGHAIHDVTQQFLHIYFEHFQDKTLDMKIGAATGDAFEGPRC